MTLHVCPLHRLDEIIVREHPARIISLLSPGQTPPITPPGTPWLLLQHHDIAEPREGLVAPRPEVISSILEFASSWREPGPIVVHCLAGVSRSTAAALILACALDPDRDENHAADALRAASPTATPNPLMIALADDLLGRQGRLIRAAARIGRGAETFAGEPFRYPVRRRQSQPCRSQV